VLTIRAAWRFEFTIKPDSPAAEDQESADASHDGTNSPV